jgi:hypothetical protein
MLERVSCSIAIQPPQRHKLSAPGRTRRDRRERASWNFCAAGCADCLLGGSVVASAKSFTSCWQAIIALRRISAIATISGSECWLNQPFLAKAGIKEYRDLIYWIPA